MPTKPQTMHIPYILALAADLWSLGFQLQESIKAINGIFIRIDLFFD